MSFAIKNFSMRAFNNDVNNSGNPGDKYSDWASYRNDVANFVRNDLCLSIADSYFQVELDGSF